MLDYSDGSFCNMANSVLVDLSKFRIDNGISGIMPLPELRDILDVNESVSKCDLLVAAVYIGSFIGSFFVWTSDLIGRREVVFMGCLITILGGILQVAASRYEMLILRHLFTGDCGAMTAILSPMCVTEIAPACWRGKVVGISTSGGSIGDMVISPVCLAVFTFQPSGAGGCR